MPRALLPGQRCLVHIAHVAADGSLEVRTIFETDEVLLEAPNWTLDGAALILNGDGALWRLPVGAAEVVPTRIDLDVPELNNDHVLDPDGEHVFMSAMDRHVYRGSLSGGETVQVTDDSRGEDFWHFLHGVSPDGSEIAYIGLRWGSGGTMGVGEIYLDAVDGSSTRQLTSSGKPADGSEYSPDGQWLYFNTEQFSDTPGHAQIARVRLPEGEPEQLTFDEAVNWFPHLPLLGDKAVYISFPPGTLGHPENLPVALNVVDTADWTTPLATHELFGGQGTINVNSWAPDGSAFAFVSYPTE